MIFLSHAQAVSPARCASLDHGFSVEEYERFHEVLHPLEHEALPKNDFKTIRAKAGELVKLGGAILKLGVPRNVDDKNAGEFKEGLKKFDAALLKFQADAERGTDDELKTSYSAVHDSFEMLAGLLPRK
jgi:soluble cytochrome b562